jgi:hypothetical protein
VRGKPNKLGEGERKVRLGQDRLAIKKRKRAETIYVVLPAPYLNDHNFFDKEKKAVITCSQGILKGEVSLYH